jgi:tetratricopeptide (TPR) repeat protein
MPTFLLYGLVGAFIVFRIKSGNVLGNAYEPNGALMVAALASGAEYAYLLSILTQCYLFFKYVLLWVFPATFMMSVDMREVLAAGLWVWPQTAGFTAFVLYPVGAAYLLFKRRRKGLLGFAMLCPWLLFATELSTVRVQEIFVMYRSYLWMPCVAAAFPFVFQRLPARGAIAILLTVTLVFVPLAWNRLTTFSDPILLWDDALRLAAKSPTQADLGRIYHNRGVAYLSKQRYQEAIRDFDLGVAFLPKHSLIYNDRAVAYLQTGKYVEALKDFDAAIWFDPSYYNPYLGRAQVYEALGNPDAARRDYARSCQLGVREVCNKF